jgi:hypothetical protein
MILGRPRLEADEPSARFKYHSTGLKALQTARQMAGLDRL